MRCARLADRVGRAFDCSLFERGLGMAKRAGGCAALLVLVLPLLLAFSASAQTITTTSSLLVKFVPGLSLEQQANVIARNGGVEGSSIPALRLHVVAVATEQLATVL